MTTKEPSRSDLLREQILEDSRSLVRDQFSELLRQEIADANMRAIATGEMPEAERNQAIGYLHGMTNALRLLLVEYEKLLRED